MLETLNPPPDARIAEEKVHARWTMQHPVMDAATIGAQSSYAAATNAAPRLGRHLAIAAATAASAAAPSSSSSDSSGSDEDGGYVFPASVAAPPTAAASNRNCNVWLAGAYLHHGFHEE